MALRGGSDAGPGGQRLLCPRGISGLPQGWGLNAESVVTVHVRSPAPCLCLGGSLWMQPGWEKMFCSPNVGFQLGWSKDRHRRCAPRRLQPSATCVIAEPGISELFPAPGALQALLLYHQMRPQCLPHSCLPPTHSQTHPRKPQQRLSGWGKKLTTCTQTEGAPSNPAARGSFPQTQLPPGQPCFIPTGELVPCNPGLSWVLGLGWGCPNEIPQISCAPRAVPSPAFTRCKATAAPAECRWAQPPPRLGCASIRREQVWRNLVN